MSTLRLIFFALLLANVGFFAWRQNAGPAEGHEPQRMQSQLDPDQVKIVGANQPTPTGTGSTADKTGKTADTASGEAAGKPEVKPTDPKNTELKATENKTAETKDTAKPAAAAPSKADAAKPENTKPNDKGSTDKNAAALLCKSFSGFSADGAKAALAAIGTNAPAARVAMIPVKDAPSYWVHIPSQGSKTGADKKQSELKQLGVDDSFIITDDGPNRWAISLGLFHGKEAADNYLQKLTKQGVRSAKIEVRDKGSDKVRLEISAPAEQLGALARDIKPLANATLGDCRPTDVKN